MRHARHLLAIALAAALAAPTATLATNGYFAHGWGTKSKAMAGVAAALPQDTLVAATNPAGMAFVGNGLDLGVSFFSPSSRGYEANGDFSTDAMGFPTAPFITPGTYDSDKDLFYIPSFGYNRELDSSHTIGVSIFGNGGMNTRYTDRPVFENFAAFPNQLAVQDPSQAPAGTIASPTGLLFMSTPQGLVPVTGPADAPNNANPNGIFTATTPTGVDLNQLFIEVPYTLKLGDGRQSIAIAPVFAIQRFKAYGLEPFRQLSINPDKVTNNGYEYTYGAGAHVGWYGELSDRLALGASYRTTVWMSKLDDYAGLFADDGEFDIPAMFNAGLAYKVQPNVTLAVDYQHIFYDEVSAIANANDLDITQCQAPGAKPAFCLGGGSGLGFGWDSMDILKLGVRWDQSAKLKLYGGVSYNSDPFKTDTQGLFNILAPAVVRWHVSVGATYAYSPKDEINIAFTYVPKETFDGTSPTITSAQSGSLYMEQKDLEVSWTHRF